MTAIYKMNKDTEQVIEALLQHEPDKWDHLLAQTANDTWWMPERVVRVTRPEIRYTYDPEGVSEYCDLQWIDPNLSEYDALIQEVVEAHKPSGNCSFLLSSITASPTLIAVLRSKGFVCIESADAWTIDVNTPRPPIPDDIEVRRVQSLDGIRDMELVMDQCFPLFERSSEETLQQNLQATLGDDARCLRFVTYDRQSQSPLAAAALNLYPEQKLGFMWGGATIPEARQRGVYSALITARMKIVQTLAYSRLGLYALRGSSGPIIKRQNFNKHGPISFWRIGSNN